MYIISYMYWCNSISISVTVPKCVLLNSCFQGIDHWLHKKKPKHFQILFDFDQYSSRDVPRCLFGKCTWNAQKIFPENIFAQFVFILTSLAHFVYVNACFISRFRSETLLCNTHRHQFLEKQLTGLPNTDFRDLYRYRYCICWQ